MNQMEIGSFIAKKRKEKNYTQAILAEKLRVSNKTISKWETGKSMPDYAVIQNLCSELDISLSELMDAEENESNSIRPYDEEQILELIRRTQNLENQRTSLYGAILIRPADTEFCGGRKQPSGFLFWYIIRIIHC